MSFGFDPNIILSASQTPQTSLSDLVNARNSATRNQIDQASLRQMLYGQQRERSLADLVSQNAGQFSDPFAQSYARGGFGQEAQEAQNQALTRQQTAAQLLKMHSDLFRGQASAIKTPEQYEQWISRVSPDVKAMYGLPDKYDADAIKGFVTTGIAPEKQAEQQIEREKLDKSRFHVVPNPVTGAMVKVDESTGATVPMGGGIGNSGGEVSAPPGSKIADFKNKVLSALGEDMDPTKGKANLPAKAQGQIAAAERFDALLNAPGPMTAQRLHEATMMAATIANGGNQPTEAMVESMYPKTLRGKGAEFWQSVLNVPMDTDSKAFVDQLRNQSERETTLGKKQIQQYLLNRVSKHPQAFQMFPDEAGKMAEGAGLKGLYDPKTLLPVRGAHPQDAQAIEWARTNRNDPLAAEILKANGVE